MLIAGIILWRLRGCRKQVTWFVSPSWGSDANAGDHPDRPFATVAAAVMGSTPGDIVAVEVMEENCEREYEAMKRMVVRKRTG